MPTKYTGRVLLILTVMYVAFCAVFPRAPISIFLPMTGAEASWRHHLRPGIDIQGGASLIYEIEVPPGYEGTGVAEQVAAALKRRVDPQGVRNLIWRPQGDTRLEIQMPLSGDVRQAEGVRQEYLAAQRQLEDLNVNQAQVTRVIETMQGPEREAELERLAMGSQVRRELFAELVRAYEALAAAKASGVIAQSEAAEREYARLKQRIEQTNLDVEQVQVAMDASTDLRQQRIEEYRARNEGFQRRQDALEAFIAAHDKFREVRDSIADTASLKRLLQGSGVLAYHILADDIPATEYQQWVERLMTSGPRPRAGDQYRWFETDRPQGVTGYQAVTGPDGKKYLLAHISDEKSLDDRDEKWGLERAALGQDERGATAVEFQLDAMGGRLFAELSGANIGRPLAIVLDNKIISAPTLQGQIRGSGIITGGATGFSEAEAGYLISTLNAGALPAQLSSEPIMERTVGPQLGADNLRAGLIVCFVGLIVTALFLVAYYYLAGLVAFLAVLLNILIILGAMAGLNATFTLPSIAGIILAVGMSVDANILIFERLREEQVRGLSLRMALRNAYDRAWSAIIDANITTGIVAAILYLFGSEEVAGFGLTLLIGIFASLFTALFMTKTIFGLLIEKIGLSDLSALPRTFPALHRALEPKIDWMSKAPVFSFLSVAAILLGLVLFVFAWRSDRVLDIEFAGGTTAQFQLRERMPIDEVRSRLGGASADDALFGVQVVSVESTTGERETLYEAVVTNEDQRAVTAAIIDRLGEILTLREPTLFTGHDQPFEAVFGDAAVPIAEVTDNIQGLAVDSTIVSGHVGGMAVVLREMDPMLSAQEMIDRFNQQRLKGVYAAEGLRGSVKVDVETLPEERAAVLFVSNDRYLYDASDAEVEAEWRREFGQPAWLLAGDAIARPDELQKVTNVGSQVASEFQRDAAIAFVLSLLGITIYIWIRFGDLTSGLAATIALAHDALFCIAAIGYAQFLAGTFLGQALLLEPFRINLTMVAAILTVIGFSINDTVVVFDRIRENRGKYGKLTRGVINEAINQTLSRTLLTSGTTLVTIAVMYIWGGPGVHGFTYALLIGILTGTYSSIIIASPLLLMGREPEDVRGSLPAPA